MGWKHSLIHPVVDDVFPCQLHSEEPELHRRTGKNFRYGSHVLRVVQLRSEVERDDLIADHAACPRGRRHENLARHGELVIRQHVGAVNEHDRNGDYTKDRDRRGDKRRSESDEKSKARHSCG